MLEILLSSTDATQLENLVGHDEERCAIMFANEITFADGADGKTRLIVRDILFPSDEDYSRRSLIEAELNPNFVAKISKRAKVEGCSIVFVHSHLGLDNPKFSAVDDDGEARLAKFLDARVPNKTHAAMVISEGGMSARELGTNNFAKVTSIGAIIRTLSSLATLEHSSEEAYDRQVRALGLAAQTALKHMHVGIVGLGGTGSIVAEELAHLGIQRITFIDPDIVDRSNLNRLAGAVPGDVGRNKVDVAAAYCRSISPSITIDSIVGDVVNHSVAKQLRNVDFIFGCTDSHGSRAVIQQLAYQYLIPSIDMGVAIAVHEDRITHVYGRVQMLAPGLPCLTCCDLLDSNQVRQDMMSEVERKADPYFIGHHEPAPAVMSLNGTVASLSVTMLLAAVTKLPSPARALLYNALNSTIRHPGFTQQPDCFICSRSGVLARANTWSLYLRRDL